VKPILSNSAIEIQQKEFLKFLLKGEHTSCSNLAQEIFKEYSLTFLYENVLKKSLYDVGELWEFNKISVATEHLASAIVEAILNEYYSDVISNKKINRTVIVACVETEYHQIGVKMINDIFELNGWTSYFLGANTPTKELISFIKSINAEMIAISLSIYFHLPILQNMIEQIRVAFPDLPILVGGQAFLRGGQEVLLKYENVVYQADLGSTDLYIKKINKDG
jgi:methanogenic corrinoid protein MtbC1